MKKLQIYVVDGQEYLATKVVDLNGKKYQELCSADIMRPDILYAETINENFELIEDWDIYYALRKKYVIDERVLSGEFVIFAKRKQKNDDWKKKIDAEISRIPELKGAEWELDKSRWVIISSGEYKGAPVFELLGEKIWKSNKSFNRKATAVVAELFESDVKEFSEKSSKIFKRIFEKQGIDSPQKWLEGKMRKTADNAPPYSYDADGVLFHNCANVDSTTGAIRFTSFKSADNRCIRAHEIVHKITTEMKDKVFGGKTYNTGRTGFHYMEINEVVDNNQVRQVLGAEIGRHFNEGVTELVTEKITGVKGAGKGYSLETFLAKRISKLVGEDVLFEAFFFDPKILENKLTEITGNKYAFVNMLNTLDEYGRLLPTKNKLAQKMLMLKYGFKFLAPTFTKAHITAVKKTLKLNRANHTDDEIRQDNHITRDSLQLAHQKARFNENRIAKECDLGEIKDGNIQQS